MTTSEKIHPQRTALYDQTLKYNFSVFDFENSMREAQLVRFKDELVNEGFQYPVV